MKGNIESD